MNKDFNLTIDSVKNSVINLASNFGFSKINDNLFLRNTKDVYLALTKDDITFFNDDKSVTFTFKEVFDNVLEHSINSNKGYTERTFYNYALSIIMN